MKHRIMIIDGMGGGIGVQLIGRLRDLGDALELVALGTNAIATERMLKAGAHRGATGENAIRVSVAQGDFIVGPIGIVISNSMMGEITPSMAEAILTARAQRILLPLQQDHFALAGLEQAPLAKMIDRAVEMLKDRLPFIDRMTTKIV
ncbi:MAG: DUF3842 family protein [Spirochaetaceae bacterium]|jgi:hypothetical protein|nr:DUF3842 family protein [Spirochaetaceae bacterium]